MCQTNVWMKAFYVRPILSSIRSRRRQLFRNYQMKMKIKVPMYRIVKRGKTGFWNLENWIILAEPGSWTWPTYWMGWRMSELNVWYSNGAIGWLASPRGTIRIYCCRAANVEKSNETDKSWNAIYFFSVSLTADERWSIILSCKSRRVRSFRDLSLLLPCSKIR